MSELAVLLLHGAEPIESASRKVIIVLMILGEGLARVFSDFRKRRSP